MTRKNILISISILSILTIFLLGLFQIILTPDPITLTVYTNPASKQGADTIHKLSQAVNAIPNKYTIDIYPPVDEEGTFLSQELQNLPDVDKERILNETAFLQKIQSTPEQLLQYSTIRVDNIETTNWQSLAEYISIVPEDNPPIFSSPPSSIENLLQNGASILLIQDQIYDINNKKTLYQLEQKLVQLRLRNGKESLSHPPNTGVIKQLVASRYNFQGRFEAYTDLDCDDKLDQIGQVVGFKTAFQRCEYQTPETITFQIFTQDDLEEIETEVITVQNLLTQILKQTEFTEPQRIPSEDVIEPPKASPDQSSIPFQIVASGNITKHPKFSELRANGIIEEIESQYFINIYNLL